MGVLPAKVSSWINPRSNLFDTIFLCIFAGDKKLDFWRHHFLESSMVVKTDSRTSKTSVVDPVADSFYRELKTQVESSVLRRCWRVANG